jgi:hypothetical protein
MERCPELFKPCNYAALGVFGDIHVDGPARRSCDHRGGERRVSAARDSQTSTGLLRAACRRLHLKGEHHAHEVARLMRAAHMLRLVLDPDTRTKLWHMCERSLSKARPIHLSDGVI